MDPKTQLQYFRKEHQDIYRLLGQFGAALDLIESQQDELRRKGIGKLRELQADLQAVQHHCESEERSLESPYDAYLKRHQLETLRQEHERLGRLTQDIVAELQFATTNQTDNIFVRGQQWIQFVRQHIAFEETLLMEIENGLTAHGVHLPSAADNSALLV
jgi:hemerythrin-like domain-containing protein